MRNSDSDTGIVTGKQLRHLVGKIHHVKDDWLTPMEYLPLIFDVLGEIDLDPCSTHDANQQFLQAKKIYTLADDGLNMEEPWKGKTYLFPSHDHRWSAAVRAASSTPPPCASLFTERASAVCRWKQISLSLPWFFHVQAIVVQCIYFSGL